MVKPLCHSILLPGCEQYSLLMDDDDDDHDIMCIYIYIYMCVRV